MGVWQTTGSHPYLPGTTLHGRTTFDWIEGGAFLLMRSEIDEPGIPSGVAIFGSDDVAQRYFMLYFDERGVSRKYNVTMAEKTLEWWRDEPSFSSVSPLAIEDDGNKMVGKGEMSRDGGTVSGEGHHPDVRTIRLTYPPLSTVPICDASQRNWT